MNSVVCKDESCNGEITKILNDLESQVNNTMDVWKELVVKINDILFVDLTDDSNMEKEKPELKSPIGKRLQKLDRQLGDFYYKIQDIKNKIAI